MKDLAEFAEEQYEVVSPALAVIENDGQSFEPDAEVKAGNGSDKIEGWVFWAHFAALLFVPRFYQKLFEVETADDSDEMDGWVWWGYFAVLIGFPTFYQQFLGTWAPGSARLAVLLVLCAPVVLFLAWFLARSRDWFWVYFVIALSCLGWVFIDLGRLPTGGWAPACGLLAELGVVASGVAAFWGWRGEARVSPANRTPAHGPAMGLILVGAVNWLALVFCVCCLAGLLMFQQVRPGYLTLTAAHAEPLLPLCVSTAVASGVILMAGIRLFHGASPDLARAASVLAMTPLTPGFWLGLPIGIWTLAVLGLGEPRATADRPVTGQDSALDGVKPAPDGLNSSSRAGRWRSRADSSSEFGSGRLKVPDRRHRF